MIDTIGLIIPQNDFEIIDYDLFTPSARGMYEPPYYSFSKGYMSCIQNVSKKELKEGIYKPKLTLSKRIMRSGFSLALKVEFSAPKLLYNNNFQEVENNDLELIINKLHRVLLDMGVVISIENLYKAELYSIHYSKNIILDTASSSMLINLLRKMDISKILDNGNTDFRNEGQAIRFHTNSYELVFYDKIQDLKSAKISDKRAVEDDNYIQINLLKDYNLERLEVLRMELRLNTKKKIKDVLGKIGLKPKNINIQTLFNKDIARDCLMWFWDGSMNKSQNILILSEQDPQIAFNKLKLEGIKDSKTLEIMGFLSIVKSDGIRSFKSLSQSKNNIYYRLQNNLSDIEFDRSYLCKVFESIRNTILEMSSIKDIEI